MHLRSTPHPSPPICSGGGGKKPIFMRCTSEPPLPRYNLYTDGTHHDRSSSDRWSRPARALAAQVTCGRQRGRPHRWDAVQTTTQESRHVRWDALVAESKSIGTSHGPVQVLGFRSLGIPLRKAMARVT